jgi:8-oxoguanine deaminase
VMIKGEWRLIDGTPPGVDIGRLRAQHGKAAAAFRAPE